MVNSDQNHPRADLEGPAVNRARSVIASGAAQQAGGVAQRAACS
jgi:hypothetical protein